MDEIVRDLVDGAYAAALDETLWAAWAWSAARLLGGVCGSFYVVEAPGIIRQRIIAHESEQIVERYINENIGRFDPQIAHVARLPATRVYADTDHVDWENRDAKEYFAWQASNGKIKHYVTAAACLSGGTHFAGLSVHRHVHDGPTPDSSRRIMNRILPDIYRSLELGFLHAEKMMSAYWEGLMTRRQEACLLLGDDGRVLRMTAEMEALLMFGDGLGCVQNHLACHEATADNRLRAFVSTLVREETAPRTCRLERPSGKAAYVMTGYPLPRRARILAPAEAAALVVVVDPTASPVSTTDRWRSAYGLTARETQFARMLTMGHSVETAAESLTISISTARVHLRNIFAKTGTSRQSELILLLSRLSI